MRSFLARLLALRVTLVAGFLLLAPLGAVAQGTDPANSPTAWVFRWLNFALLFGVGGWWAWRRLKVAFRRRADKIATTIADAEAVRREAEERLRAAEAKIASIENEAAAMRDRARRDSAAEAERIRGIAEEEAARVARAADAEIAAAERAAINRLRETAIARTIERARTLIAERVTPAVDARLLGRFVDALSRNGIAS